jgi:UTP--glucose-1-phosphate uridylyltransferase
MKKVTKAVFPVAGHGHRFLAGHQGQSQGNAAHRGQAADPVRGGRGGGGRHHRSGVHHRPHQAGSIEDHFDKAYELETELETAQGQAPICWRSCGSTVPSQGRERASTSASPRRWGSVTPCCAPSAVVGDEPVCRVAGRRSAGFTGDGSGAVMQQMVERLQLSSLFGAGRDERGPARTDRASTASSAPSVDTGEVQRVSGIVEKPKPEEAPSTQAVIGRYILTGRIFDHLRAAQARGRWRASADRRHRHRCSRRRLCWPTSSDGVRYDCGSKLGYLQATVELGLKHPEVGAEFAAFLASRK